MASQQVVIFSLNDENFGIEISKVKLIEKPMNIYRLPDTPEYIEGIINFRGTVYTVINLRKKFDLPSKDYDEATKIVIINSDTSSVGFVVDDVKEIVWVDEEDIDKSPKTIADLNKGYIEALATVETGKIMLIDIDSVVLSSSRT